MSKFFFKGRIDPREKYQRFGYNTQRKTKLGSENAPLAIQVQTTERESELRAVLQQHNLYAEITLDPDQPENTLQLDTLLQLPGTQKFAKTPSRNDPCLCGSGKKYKKCCG
ncbi:SEC-C domain-containing protein [Paraglaciecola agarilytica]|uniref:PBPRA1643 family SWIM/SEC-C metal-binding motif protein n=1 Tax=Paraglaciecola chathamensis TaxID=368405 RepID=UPI001C07F17A|nr:PBPRA1643 family SWIM/SEC-C metal-binding motif protein [Paraglaciecola agarilytica]MBU3018747.1 SEC-C domain-containing protein [Paraglaciecola agarilytica]